MCNFSIFFKMHSYDSDLITNVLHNVVVKKTIFNQQMWCTASIHRSKYTTPLAIHLKITPLSWKICLFPTPHTHRTTHPRLGQNWNTTHYFIKLIDWFQPTIWGNRQLKFLDSFWNGLFPNLRIFSHTPSLPSNHYFWSVLKLFYY